MDSLSCELLDHARALLGEFSLATPDCSAGSVAAAIRAKSGKIYSGVCLHLPCGIGFCAEHAAVAEMLKSRETRVDAIVAVLAQGFCLLAAAVVNCSRFSTQGISPPSSSFRMVALACSAIFYPSIGCPSLFDLAGIGPSFSNSSTSLRPRPSLGHAHRRRNSPRPNDFSGPASRFVHSPLLRGEPDRSQTARIRPTRDRVQAPPNSGLKQTRVSLRSTRAA